MADTTTAERQSRGRLGLAVLATMFLVALASWGAEHAAHGHGDGWWELLDVTHLFSLLGVLGSVLGAWLAKSVPED